MVLAAAPTKKAQNTDYNFKSRFATVSAGAHRCDAVDEFGFTDRPHFDRPRVPLHGGRFDEYGRDDVVTAAGIGQQIIEHVTPPRSHPQMMMRIDDRQLRLKDRLLPPIKPILSGNRQQGCRLLCICYERPSSRACGQTEELSTGKFHHVVAPRQRGAARESSAMAHPDLAVLNNRAYPKPCWRESG